MISKKYQIINNIGGWFVFLIALCTYWLTLEPTASYWDCGEFIIQADKLEVGHPPGNPIFMLTARFFANFASSPETVSVMVNAMSGLLSALTILLMFWTITHLVRRLIVRDDDTRELSIQKYLAIMGSGLVGSLAYCWSDTFWFSAVEGEVYAFSSFCTALVFWLILKWENRADTPGSDRYLILIAYIIGVSVAVHLLNLLCIPAIVLVFCYRKYKDMSTVKSLLALLLSFAIIVLVLYGLVPGFIKVAQQFELFFVNSCGMSFNSGALIYAAVTFAVFCATLWLFSKGASANTVRIMFLISVTLSGMLFIGSGVWLGIILTIALAAALWLYYRGDRRLPMRTLNIVMWSIAVIFVGYSSYALILIRSSADTPMNQNSPDNVFDLASYLNREQYGENPLFYGHTLYSGQMRSLKGYATDTLGMDEAGNVVTLSSPYYSTVSEKGKALYSKGVKGANPEDPDGFLTTEDNAHNASLAMKQGDYYVKRGYKVDTKLNPELDMFFPRIYSSQHAGLYGEWVNLDTVPDNIVAVSAIDEISGEKVPEFDTSGEPQPNATGNYSFPVKMKYRPTYGQNLSYFFNYQLNHMYMRYFMWNFAGRQNDLLNQHGELDAGNWISGIPFIDNPRLGDQKYLPDDLGKNNAGHNVYFMLPLLLGIIGLLWQAFAGRRGIEQFWVIFFLFFMTGIAIVIYLNQPPGQPRERDYAFAGSFYAFAIWIGMGVAGLWRIFTWCLANKKYPKRDNAARDEELQPSIVTDEPQGILSTSRLCAIAACVIGVLVPIQMVSQTWDDHDRSGRYAARDYGANYLESLEPNAIVFCNGDNDTFPLWYAQEVEGVRPDVKIVNLSYLASDWYANQQRLQSYTAPGIKFTAKPADYAYGRSDATFALANGQPMSVLDALKGVYAGNGRDKYGYPAIDAKYLYIPVDKKAVVARGLVAPQDTAAIEDMIVIDLANAPSVRSKGYVSLSELLMLDIIATNAANGWERPIYWAQTVGTEYHLGLTPYLRSTGMTHQLVPTIQQGMAPRNDRAYNVVTKKYRWGGADSDRPPYFDETAGRMLTSMRSSMLEVAEEFLYQGKMKADKGDAAGAKADWKKGLEVVDLMINRLRATTLPYSLSTAITSGQLLCEFGSKEYLNDPKALSRGLAILKELAVRYAQYVVYNQRMAAQFINPSMTIESQLVPYQYYHIIELYSQYGGDVKRLEAQLKGLGIDLKVMKDNYDTYMKAANSREAGAAADVGGEAEQMLSQVAAYAATVNRLAALSPEEYAKQPEQDRIVDSMYYDMIRYLEQLKIDVTPIKDDENYKKVDLERSRRINDEFIKKHPDLAGN